MAEIDFSRFVQAKMESDSWIEYFVSITEAVGVKDSFLRIDQLVNV